MTTADDRHDQDVWAQTVAEAAEARTSVPRPTPGPTPEALSEPTLKQTPEPVSEPTPEPVSEPVSDAVAEPAPEAVPPASPSDLFGPELSPLVDEVRRFASSLGEKVTAVSASVGSGDSLGALQNLAAPLRSKHPEVYGHLIAAGGELLAAYRSAVSASERRWTAEKPASSEQIDLD